MIGRAFPLELAIDPAAGLELLARSRPLWRIGVAAWSYAVASVRAFAEAWDGRARAAGWTAIELYRLHCRAPYARLAAMGAAWLIARSGHRAVGVDAGAIVVGTHAGNRRASTMPRSIPAPRSRGPWQLEQKKARRSAAMGNIITDDPRIAPFFRKAYERVGRAALSLSEEPEAKRLTRDEECTAIAAACLRAAAVAIAPMPEVEADAFEGLLTAEVAKVRARMLDLGLGIRRS